MLTADCVILHSRRPLCADGPAEWEESPLDVPVRYHGATTHWPRSPLWTDDGANGDRTSIRQFAWARGRDGVETRP
jgi:hypothetical protein